MAEWTRHIATRKHLVSVDGNIWKSMEIKKHQTEKLFCNCGKKYQTESGLWKHKKKCNVENEDENKIISQETDKDKLINYLMKENSEFKEMILEQSKMFMKISENNGNSINNNNGNINSHNKTKFNLNFFLNEQCKDAINIMDFVNELQVKITDLENVGELGYAEGISKIFIKGLKEMDIYKRPIHCSDLKREVLYVKDQDTWEKENDENKKIKKAIHHIGSKNIQQITKWVDANPNCKDSESKKNDVYLQIVNQSMGGVDEKNIEKIIHNISKEVVIEK
jgi:hypothetical protein